MKSTLFKINKLSDHPIAVQYENLQKDYKKFHYHKQVQITFIKKGSGTLICGNTSVKFGPGNLFVIGQNISHVFTTEQDEIIESYSFYFHSEWLLSVLDDIFTNHFLSMSNQVIHLKNFEKHLTTIETIADKAGIIRLKEFFHLIELISKNQKDLILPKTFNNVYSGNAESDKLNIIYAYINQHLNQKITLDELAELTHLTKESLCRFFKQRTQKTITTFINELRINNAGKLLVETDLNVEEVCYKSGFNNFSNFNRQFQKYLKTSPKKYRIKQKELINPN